jgi:hypothetical protein
LKRDIVEREKTRVEVAKATEETKTRRQAERKELQDLDQDLKDLRDNAARAEGAS